MRGLLLAVVTTLACWLALVSPAQAQQVSNPLADLILAGAPLVALGPMTSSGGEAAAADTPSAASPPVSAAQPDISAANPVAPQAPAAPAFGIPGIPNPLDALDPRKWASEVLDAVITMLGKALLEAIRGFSDWALGFGDSSLNFVTRTPASGSYESETVRSLWDFSRAIANAGLALIVMWGGFNIIVKEHTRSPYHGAMELLPRVILGALAANLTLELARLVIDTNNALAAGVGQVGLPGYDQAGATQEGVALVFVALAYGVIALLLVFQMLMRLALIDVLIVLAPVMMLLWVLPQTQGWTRWWTNLFPITVFQQSVQMVVLRLGASLMVELTPGSASNALLTLLLGIAVCWLTLKVPSLLRGQVHQAGIGSVVSLVVLSRLGTGLATRRAGASAAE